MNPPSQSYQLMKVLITVAFVATLVSLIPAGLNTKRYDESLDSTNIISETSTGLSYFMLIILVMSLLYIFGIVKWSRFYLTQKVLFLIIIMLPIGLPIGFNATNIAYRDKKIDESFDRFSRAFLGIIISSFLIVSYLLK